jgi:ATP-dependent DNA helicase RecQ
VTQIEELEQKLKQHFGFDEFLPGQREVIECALSGRDALVLMPTGGGKSLTYQLPALLLQGLTIVVSPLIALMQDQVDRLQANGIAASFVNSTLSADELSRRERKALTGQLRLLYVAPERLLTRNFLALLDEIQKHAGLSLFAIDEAHCVSEWGHDFRPDYRQLSILRKRHFKIPIMALTATATERVRNDICDQLLLNSPYIHIASFNRPNLYYEVKLKNPHSYHDLRQFLGDPANTPAIVYCQTRKNVDDITEALNLDGIKALPYHAGLLAEQRAANQASFIRDDTPVLVATIAFGMGIAKPDVRSVIHYDMPKSLEGYYQESGRAGRDGLPAQCVLFFQRGDRIKLEFMLQQKMDEQEQLIARRQIQQVIAYSESTVCRRQTLLTYFGEAYTVDNCGRCDNCLTPQTVMEDRTIDAQKFLSCVSRTEQRFGMRHIIDILRGANTQKVRNFYHHWLSTYGIGKDVSVSEWQRLGRALIQQGLLNETQDGYSILKLNSGSVEILKKLRTFELAAPPTTSTRRRNERDTTNSAQELSPAESALFQQLRTLRKGLADELGVPPYVVFPDNSLQAMAQWRPQDAAHFAPIPGVGQRKLEAYGSRFTATIREFCLLHNLEMDLGPVEEEGQQDTDTHTNARPNAGGGTTHQITLHLYKAGKSVEEIAQERSLKPSTIISHLTELIEDGEDIDLTPLISPDRYNTIVAALNQAGLIALKPAKELLGDDYSYDEIKLVRASLRNGKGKKSRQL